MTIHNSSTQPIFDLIAILSKKWVLLVIHSLLVTDSKHFNDIKKELDGISSRMLSQRLTELEKAGFVIRSISKKKPTSITYTLTKKGNNLISLYKVLVRWSEKWN